MATSRDPEIREALLGRLRAETDSLILQEWDVSGLIVDVATVTPTSIVGYEIKSAADSRVRLARQVPIYNEVMDACWLVGAPKHVDNAVAKADVPGWWGLMTYDAGQLTMTREAQPNPSPSWKRRLWLLWRTECAALAARYGMPRTSSVGKGALVQYLLRLPEETARRELCAVLRARRGWRTEEGRSLLGAELRAHLTCRTKATPGTARVAPAVQIPLL